MSQRDWPASELPAAARYASRNLSAISSFSLAGIVGTSMPDPARAPSGGVRDYRGACWRWVGLGGIVPRRAARRWGA